MVFKLELLQLKKQEPELVARKFCDEIQKRKSWLRRQTCKPENNPKTRDLMLSLRDEYNRNLESGSCGRLVQLADRVSNKVLEIIKLNPEDWNNYRRGQQFRRLDESLGDFEVEWFRSQQNPESPYNVVPFRT